MGATNNVPVAEALQVSTKSIGDWIRETSEPRLQKRRALEKKIEETMLKIRMEADAPPPPQPEPLTPPADASPEEVPQDPPKPPKPPKPAVRSLLPEDRRWDV